MKRNWLLFLFACCCIQSLSAQEYNDELAIRKGNVLISGGYGAPSIIRAFLKLKTTRDQIQVYGEGPFIFKVDYMLSNRFSIGFNSIYNYTRIAWLQDGYDPVTFEKKQYESGVIGNEISATLRGNYYFWRRNKITSYGGLALGYGNVNIKSYTKAPTPPFEANYNLPSPLRFEGTVGLRYFPLPFIGIYSELGLGKSWILLEKYFIPEALIQLGITVKL